MDAISADAPGSWGPTGAPAPAAVLRRVEQALPSTQIAEVRVSEMPGWWQLIGSRSQHLGYIDGTFKWYALGVVFDLKRGVAIDGSLDGKHSDDSE